MRIVYMGADAFGIPAMRRVLAMEGVQVVHVVTQPDRPKGRGLKLAASPVKDLAVEHRIPISQPESAKSPEFIDSIAAIAPDLILVIAYGQILKKRLIDIPPLGVVNLHASLLPAYRGGAPVERALMAGETITGNTTFYIDPGMDSGDMILQESLAIDPDDTAGTLRQRLAQAGGELVERTLRLIIAGGAPRIPQDHAQATLARNLKKEEAELDWRKSAAEIRNLVRGANPRPGAYSRFRGKLVKFWSVEGEAPADPADPADTRHPTPIGLRSNPADTRLSTPDTRLLGPGTIVHVDKDGFQIATGAGLIRPLLVQPEGRAVMDDAAFARGQRIQVGEAFGLPLP